MKLITPIISSEEKVKNKKIYCGHETSFFLTTSGEVWSCGLNSYGQLGRAVEDGSTTSINLEKIPDLSNITAIITKVHHSLFLTTSGEVWSCGYNLYGQLGRKVASGSNMSVNLEKIPDLSNIIAISSGNSHSLFLTASGEVWSCGRNSGGQLGRKVSDGSSTSVNLGKTPDLSNIIAIFSGNSYSLLLTTSGKVWSCGDNYYGHLGREVASGSNTSVNLGEIPDLSNIIAISSGGQHSLFLTTSGEVWSCGNNYYGQLGREVASGSPTSVNLEKIPDLSNIIAISSGVNHSLFLTASGEVWSCGYNSYGQLGRKVANGSTTSVNLGEISFEI
jgi:alpha-tubulin suppressor-like RCC1 family protein